MGGIGSGKSTVASELAKMGCKVIDADKIVHKLLEKPEVREKLLSAFGVDILDSEGKISREKLADVVFCDKTRLKRINSILHPLVLERTEELIRLYEDAAEVKAIVLDMPLLVEVGWEKRCDKLIFVDCKEKIRLKRAEKNALFKENQLKNREIFQIPLDNKANIADNTVDNNSDLSALVRQIIGIFYNIMSDR